MNPENLEAAPHPHDSEPGVPVQQGLFTFPVPDGREPALLANRCTTCGKTFFPKRHLCTECFDRGQLEEITLSRHGIVYSATHVHVSSPAGIKAPYVYGYVEIPENNLRVYTLFSGNDTTKFVPGCKVELHLEPIKTDQNGTPVVGHTFRTTEK